MFPTFRLLNPFLCDFAEGPAKKKKVGKKWVGEGRKRNRQQKNNKN